MKAKKGVVPPQLRKYLFKKSRGQPMAKRKYNKVRSAGRRVYAFAKRGAKRSYRASKGASMSLLDIGFSFGYGYARSYIVNNSMVQKVISMIPFGGDYKDNIFLGLGAYLVNMLLKPTNHYVKLGLRTIVQNEAFLAGAKMNMGASLTTTVVSSASSTDLL